MEGMRREMYLFLNCTACHVQPEMIPMRIWLRDECLVKSFDVQENKSSNYDTRLQGGLNGYAK